MLENHTGVYLENSSNIYNSTAPPPTLPPMDTGEYVQCVFYPLAVSIGVTFNIALIVTIAKSHELRKPLYTLILSLATGDILFSTVVVPVFLVSLYTRRQFVAGTTCQFMGFMAYALAYQSMYTILFLTLDRYWAICSPMKTLGLRSSQRAYGVFLVFAWLMAIILAFPPIFGYGGEYIFYLDLYGCHFNWAKGTHSRVYTSLGLGALMFYPGSVIVTFVYINIFRTLRQVLGQEISVGDTQQQSQRNTMLKEIKAAVSILIIFGVFAVAWFPFVGLKLYSQNTGHRYSVAERYSQLLFTLPNLLNPVVYGWMNREVRDAFVRKWRPQAVFPGAAGN